MKRWPAYRLLAIAGAIFVAFGVAHVLGLRPFVAILSGTAPPGTDGPEGVLYGIVYVMLYFAAVVVAPVLVIAALLMHVVLRVLGGAEAGNDAEIRGKDEDRA